LVGRDQRASVRGRRATGVANDQDACAARRLVRIPTRVARIPARPRRVQRAARRSVQPSR